LYFTVVIEKLKPENVESASPLLAIETSQRWLEVRSDLEEVEVLEIQDEREGNLWYKNS